MKREIKQSLKELKEITAEEIIDNGTHNSIIVDKVDKCTKPRAYEYFPASMKYANRLSDTVDMNIQFMNQVSGVICGVILETEETLNPNFDERNISNIRMLKNTERLLNSFTTHDKIFDDSIIYMGFMSILYDLICDIGYRLEHSDEIVIKRNNHTMTKFYDGCSKFLNDINIAYQENDSYSLLIMSLIKNISPESNSGRKFDMYNHDPYFNYSLPNIVSKDDRERYEERLPGLDEILTCKMSTINICTLLLNSLSGILMVACIEAECSISSHQIASFLRVECNEIFANFHNGILDLGNYLHTGNTIQDTPPANIEGYGK